MPEHTEYRVTGLELPHRRHFEVGPMVSLPEARGEANARREAGDTHVKVQSRRVSVTRWKDEA